MGRMSANEKERTERIFNLQGKHGYRLNHCEKTHEYREFYLSLRLFCNSHNHRLKIQSVVVEHLVTSVDNALW